MDGKTSFLKTIMDIFTQINPPEWLSKEEYLKKSSDLHALIIVSDSKSNALKALCIGMNKINVEKKVYVI